MVILYLYCAINIYIYVFGPPDVGKNEGNEYLIRIRTEIEKLDGNIKNMLLIYQLIFQIFILKKH